MVATTYTTTSESITVAATSSGDNGSGTPNGNVLYTCPDNHDSTIDYLGISNGGTANAKITIEFYHLDDTSYNMLASSHTIAGNTTYHLLNADRFHLHAGDKIICSKDSGTLAATISCRQYFNPTR
jgi:hypothetical protein|tara:strand:- start:20 stop:397 length:378 start_codon:yes stop_codon:yes gene_type:complete